VKNSESKKRTRAQAQSLVLLAKNPPRQNQKTDEAGARLLKAIARTALRKTHICCWRIFYRSNRKTGSGALEKRITALLVRSTMDIPALLQSAILQEGQEPNQNYVGRRVTAFERISFLNPTPNPALKQILPAFTAST